MPAAPAFGASGDLFAEPVPDGTELEPADEVKAVAEAADAAELAATRALRYETLLDWPAFEAWLARLCGLWTSST